MNSKNVPSSLRILLNPVTFKKDRLILKHRVHLNLRFLVITRKAGFGESELNRCLSQLTPVAQQAGRHNTLVKKIHSTGSVQILFLSCFIKSQRLDYSLCKWTLKNALKSASSFHTPTIKKFSNPPIHFDSKIKVNYG